METREDLLALRQRVRNIQEKHVREAKERKEERARWKGDPPVCGQCGARAVLMAGSTLYPCRHLPGRVFWACPDRHEATQCDPRTLRPKGALRPLLPPFSLVGEPPPDHKNYRNHGRCQRSDCREFEVRALDHKHVGSCRSGLPWKERCHSLRPACRRA